MSEPKIDDDKAIGINKEQRRTLKNHENLGAGSDFC